ncbi:MAG: hypothetical protein EU548_03130 [Promethearchaeota archaeon]|nr:MAG: hypothetical protein EU548_03130 [Candidatus Lokiarchaeota archaeon]
MKSKKILLIPFFILITMGSVAFLITDNNYRANKFDSPSTSITPPRVLYVGVAGGPLHIDPIDAWDPNSFNVIDQVAEGLFGYNLSHTEVPIIPVLAEDFGAWGTVDAEGHINYTVDIKDGVTFHDGSTLNATDVKWTFDRIENMLNLDLVEAGELYQYHDPEENLTKNVINTTYIIDNNTIAFELNSKYGPFEPLLTFQGSYILPSEGQIPFDNYIELNTGDLIGTGPFDYISYESGAEVKFESFDNYRNGAAHFDKLIYKIIQENNARNQALLDGEVHIVLDTHEDFYDEFNSSINNLELKAPENSFDTDYLCMNNVLINKTVRKAISYAIDYDYIINEMYNGYAKRLKSPIPSGTRYSNNSFNVPILNTTKARIIMQDMGYGTSFSLDDDNAWETATFLSYKYTYNTENEIRESILGLLQDNLSGIGIDIIADEVTYYELIVNLLGYPGYSRDNLNLWWYGFEPSYNDPSEHINNHFTNRTKAINTAQVNDSQVQLWMEEALFEIDENVRERLYDKIQKRLVEEIFPWAWGIENRFHIAYVENLKGYPTNSMLKSYFYPCYFIDYDSPTWQEPLTNQNVIYDKDFFYDVNASDISTVAYSINDSVNFFIDSETGILKNNTILSIGDYWLNITVEDAYGNRNNEIIKVMVKDSDSPTDAIISYPAGIIISIALIATIGLVIIVRNHINLKQN